MVDGADDHADGDAIIDSDMQMFTLEGSKEKGPVDHVHVHMSLLMQLVVLMNMLTLMQDGDMQMLMLEGSKEKGPGMLLQGGRLLSDSTFQMDTSMTWLHMVKNGSEYFQ